MTTNVPAARGEVSVAATSPLCPAGWSELVSVPAGWNVGAGRSPSGAPVVPLVVVDGALGRDMLGARESEGDGTHARAADKKYWQMESANGMALWQLQSLLVRIKSCDGP